MKFAKLVKKIKFYASLLGFHFQNFIPYKKRPYYTQSYVASRVCNVDCQYLSKLCPPSPPRRVMCIDDGRRLSSLRKGWYLLLGDLVPCVFISSSIDQLRLDWTRSVLSGPRFSLPVTALPSSCSGAKAVRACH